ncbi:unnamed protein product, partial [Prorocentrum cordatum]
EETSTSSGWAPKPRPRPSPRRCGGSGRSCGAGAEDHDEPNHEVSEVDADLLGRRWTPCSGARRSSPGAVPEAPPGVSGLALQALIRITSFAEFAAEAEHRHKMLDDEPITLTNHPAAYGRPRHRSGAAAQQGCVCSEPCMNRHRSHFEGVLSFVHLFNPPSVPPSPPPPSGTHT